MPESDQTAMWVRGAQEGDLLALSKLLASHHPVLRARVDVRMDPSLRARMGSEDILQQAYLEVFQRIDRFENRGPNSFINWVLTIVDNEINDARRAAHRQKRDVAREVSPQSAEGTGSYIDLMDRLYADSPTASRVFRHEEAVGALLACLSGLSDPHRRVIRLRFLEGLSVNDVARRLDKSQAAVVALTGTALAALRKSMDHLGEFTRG